MVGSDRELRLNLPDGRQLEVLADGPADGLPLLFHYGTPCGAVRYRPLVEAAARRELRTIVYSRPGYGTSTAKHGRSIADAVKDVDAILGELGADEFVTIGWSGGGPHAPPSGTPSRTASRVGVTTIWRLCATGDSTSRRSIDRWRCGRASRIGWCPSRTDNGWRNTFRIHGCTCAAMRVICRWQ